MATDAVPTAETRGRPRLRDDDEILRAALQAFAEHGYDGMSLRTLNAEMGLSRGTINQRFGSKEQLWYAAVEHEFRHLIDDLNAELQQRAVPDDDLSQVREGIRAFLIASVQEALRLWREKSWKNSPGFFLACWAVFPIVFFSFSQSKLPSYILPAVPALALIAAIGAGRSFQRGRTNAIILAAGISVFWIVLAAIFLHAARKFPFAEMGRATPVLAVVAVAIAIAVAAGILYAGTRRDLRLAVILCSIGAVATLEIANTTVLPALDPYISARPHAAFFRNDLHPDRIFTYELRRSWNYGLAFYFHREIPEWSPQDPDAALVLTSREGFEKIQKAGRFHGTEEPPYQGVLYVPIAAAPR